MNNFCVKVVCFLVAVLLLAGAFAGCENVGKISDTSSNESFDENSETNQYRIDELESEIDRLCTLLSAADDDNEDLLNQITNLQDEISSLKNSTVSDKNSYKTRIKELENEINRLNDLLSAADFEKENLSNQIMNLQDEISSLKNSTVSDENSYEEPSESFIIEKEKYNDSIIASKSYGTMYLYSEAYFFYMNDMRATIELYVDVPTPEKFEDICPDDNQKWSLLVRQGDYVYKLIDKKAIQLGDIRYFTWEDLEESKVYVMAVITQGSGITVEKFTFDPQSQTFTQETIFKTSGSGVFTSTIKYFV